MKGTPGNLCSQMYGVATLPLEDSASDILADEVARASPYVKNYER